MRVLLLLGSVLLVSVLKTCAAPTDEVTQAGTAADCEPVPKEPPPTPCDEDAVPKSGYRKETLDTVKKSTAESKVETQAKEKVKVKTKHLKNGNTVTIIRDKTRSKTKKDELSDDYSQTNHTVTQGGVEDSTSLTSEKKHKLHEVDVHKKDDKEVIVTDKYGHVVSDTHKVKEKDKVKKKEKDIQKKKLVHTVKSVPTEHPSDSCGC